MLRKQNIGATESTSQVSLDASSRSFPRPWHRWIPFAVLAASILVTLMFLNILPSSFRLNESSDYLIFYEPVARSILAGQGFSPRGWNPPTQAPPGYSLVLAGTFDVCHLLGIPEGIGLSAISVLGMGLVSVFIFLLARMLWGILPALISSVMWMTYPVSLWLTKHPNTEIPFMVFFYGGLCLFWWALSRRMPARVYALCGLVFGFAMLIRPIAIGIGFVLALTIWVMRRETSRRLRLLLISMLLLGNVVAVLPWEVWVYAKTGRAILLSENGANSLRVGLTFALNNHNRVEMKVSPDIADVMEDIAARSDEMLTFRGVVSVVATEFRAHPVATAKLYLLKLSRSWYATDSRRKELPILLIQLPYLAFALWCVGRAWRRGGVHRNFAMGALMLVIYFWGMTVLGLSILRYMVPVIGLLFIVISSVMFRQSSSIPKSFAVKKERAFLGDQ